MSRLADQAQRLSQASAFGYEDWRAALAAIQNHEYRDELLANAEAFADPQVIWAQLHVLNAWLSYVRSGDDVA